MQDELELAVARRLRQANRKFDEAIAKLNGKALPPEPSGFELLGQMVRQFNDAIAAAWRQFHEGYRPR